MMIFSDKTQKKLGLKLLLLLCDGMVGCLECEEWDDTCVTVTVLSFSKKGKNIPGTDLFV